MKKAFKPILCARCGEEILPSELTAADERVCALCQHIMIEANAINRENKPSPSSAGKNIYRLKSGKNIYRLK